MEEKKLDLNSVIGFVLIFGILIYWFYTNQPSPEELKSREVAAKQVQDSLQNLKVSETKPVSVSANDSLNKETYLSEVGAFGYKQPRPGLTAIENNVLELQIDNLGGQIVKARLKGYVTFDSVPVYLVKDGNSDFNLEIKTSDNRTLNTRDLYFEPSLQKDGENQVLSMKAFTGENSYLEYVYTLTPEAYMIDFEIRTKGLSKILKGDKVPMSWDLTGIRHSKSVQYENRYTRLTYRHEGDEISKLGATGEDKETEKQVRWISFRQHFFSSILAANTPFETVDLSSRDLVEDEGLDVLETKEFSAETALGVTDGALNHKLNWYFGPTDLDTLATYDDLALADSIPFGWGIFGWINRYIFTPFFGVLSSFLPFGMAIVVMTILVRVVMSPVTYKSYLSQAKMRVLKPEITEINEKFKDNAMKRQQETMALYNKAGVSPMSGCVPAVLQLPIFYALFMFFPTSFSLRQKSFLWAEDLSSYDTVAQLPFSIPFYGDHISLFPILASIAIFFYMLMTTGQQMQTQPGMPNMKFIMYLSPVMMLFFFNNYASGLSLYYFVSNLITIGIMLVIKHVILDENKIHLQIQEQKKKPRKENRFQRKMREMMEEAEKQKKR
jgi:YidC/Oxa1 family membrane protein insertase